MPNGTTATGTTPAQLETDLKFTRLCFEVACGAMCGLGELVECTELRAAVVADIVGGWLGLTQAQRDGFVRPRLPDSGLVNFAWEYIDRVSGRFDSGRFDSGRFDSDRGENGCAGPFGSELAFATHWQRHAMRLVPDSKSRLRGSFACKCVAEDRGLVDAEPGRSAPAS